MACLAMIKRENWPKSSQDFWLLSHVSELLIILRLLIPFLNLNKLLSWISRTKHPVSGKCSSLSKTVRYIDALLYRFPTNPRGSCLIRSLALFYFSTRAGLPVRFHCGVRREDTSLEGHAWLSLNGEPFQEIGNPIQTYTVTLSFPLDPHGSEVVPN